MRVWFFKLIVILLGALGACSKREDPAPVASQRPVEVAAPPGLLAELTIPEARRLWGALRKLGGSRAEALPSSFELALFAALDMPPGVLGHVRPETPVVGALFALPGQPSSAVLALRTVRGGELAAARPVERDGSPVTILVGPKPKPVLGVVDDWLLVGDDAKTLRAAGVYVARGLGARKMPDAPLTLVTNRGALAGPVPAAVKQRWTELRSALSTAEGTARAQYGRAPDFGDPTAILRLLDGVVDGLAELLASSENVRLTLRPENDRLELVVSMAPGASGALAQTLETLEVGPLDPLLDLPAGVPVALLARSSSAEREKAAGEPADVLRAVLGPRLPEKDAAPLAAALRSFHRGRGSVTLLGALAGPGIFLKQDAADPKELERGLRGLFGGLRVPALVAPLEPIVGTWLVRENQARIAGIEGPVHRVELSKATPSKSNVDVLMQVRGSGALTVAAPKGSDAFLSLSRGGGESLRTLPALAALAGDSAPATLALYADVSVMRPGSGPAPGLVVLGKRGRDAVVEVDLSASACAALFELVGSP